MAKRSNYQEAQVGHAPPEASKGATTVAPPHDMAERVGQRIGNFTSRTLRGVFRAVGRVREEAEDVWAEAQALRHREANGTAAPAADV